MKSRNSQIGLYTFVFFLTILSACKPYCEKHPDDAECLGENELITTVSIQLTDTATGQLVQTVVFRDVNADGVPETFDTIKLSANRVYSAQIAILNEAAQPAVDLTNEIEEEANDHLLVYNATGSSITFTYLDFDGNNPPLPLGLRTLWQTGAAGNFSVNVRLRHQPGVKDGTAIPGDTDISVDFPAILQ